MALEQMRLTDLVAADALQDMQDTFALTSHTSVVIVDPDGNRITKPSNWDGLCELFSETGTAGSACAAGIGELIAHNRRTGRAASAQCPRSSLTTAAVPIILDDVYLGSWFFGHLHIQNPAEQTQNDRAQQDQQTEEMRRMRLNLPKITDEEFNHIVAFLDATNRLVVRLGQSSATASRAVEEMKAMSALQQSHWDMLRKFVDSSDVALYICAFDSGEILMVNEYHCKQAGMAMEEVLGEKCWEVNGLTEQQFFAFCPRERLVDRQGNPTGAHTWSYYNEAFGAWLNCTGQAIAWEGEKLALMITQMDVTREHEIQSMLTEAAFYDKYTGLPNSEKLAHDTQLLKYRDGAEQTLICLHISNMHNINNIYGRENGFELLRAITRWLQSKDYSGCTIYRTEGYGFCLALGSLPMDRAKAIAGEIKARFAEAWRLGMNGQAIYYFCTVTMSIIVLGDNSWDTDILNLIDRTLLQSCKQQDILIYDDAMDQMTQNQIQFEMALKHSIGAGMEGFDVHYQPIVETQTGTWKGIEALCRWSHPVHGSVPPGVFIPEAERLGLICPLGEWVLETAVRQCKELRLDEIDGFFLSVNISAMQMLDEYFADRVYAVLDHWDFPGHKLSLEITETVELSFGSYAGTVIEQLQKGGIRIALDDFGTGYSSFSYLRKLPVNYVKTDRGLISDIEHDSCLQYYYYVLSEIAHSDSMMMIAEGVETVEQLESIKANGADYIQGFLFSRPLTSGQLCDSLENFESPDSAMFPDPEWFMDINEWLGEQKAYIVTPGLLKLLNQCMCILMSEADLNTAFQAVLEMVGEHFQVDRTFVYLHNQWEGMDGYHEWQDNGALSFPSTVGREALKWIVSCLMREEGMININDIARLPPAAYEALHPLGINSALVLSMQGEMGLTGLVGLCDAAYRTWSPEEIITLWNLCIIMNNCIRRERMQLLADRRHNVLIDILKNAALNVFVGDVETGEIVWANDMLRSKHQTGMPLEGQKCHQALFCREERCPHCKIGKLVDHPELGQLSYEYFDEKKGRSYMAYNSLIPWENHKQVFVEYAMDITEHLNTQRQIEFFSSTDMLTGALNRASILEQLKMRVREAQYDDDLFTIAYVDVNNLKGVNAAFGQNGGDRLLCATVVALRESVRRDDIVGRLGGDEFVVIFPDCRKSIAIERMRSARELLYRQERAYYKNAPIQFSFGVAENIELPYKDAESTANGLLQIAEQRMRASRCAGRKIRTPVACN